MTLREAMAWALEQLAASPTPRQDARLLLLHLLKVDPPTLAAHGERALTSAEVTALQAAVARARRGEPIPYIVGSAPFYGLDFAVTAAVLIPRPETELLVEAALQWANAHKPRRVIDVGTGSGCIAVTLARHLPAATVIAGDVSAAALALARRNAERHGVAERVDFYQGSLLQPLAPGLELIVANLPYVSDTEWTTLDDGVKWYEPASALRGGQGGLDLIGDLLHQARPRLTAGGVIFLEIGWRQGAPAQQLAQSIFPTAAITIQTDYAGHDRIVRIETA
jgi:release factor glutamine methyltransferase